MGVGVGAGVGVGVEVGVGVGVGAEREEWEECDVIILGLARCPLQHDGDGVETGKTPDVPERCINL